MSIANQQFTQATKVRKVWVKPGNTTTYRPKEWTGSIQAQDNYSYALNMPEVGESAMGQISFVDSGKQDISSPKQVIKLLHQDDLEEFKTLPLDGSHVIAVFWTPNEKGTGKPAVHTFRRDHDPEQPNDEQPWSHLNIRGARCGEEIKPTQLDENNKLITDPLKCYIGDNYEFVGYFAFNYNAANPESPGIEVVPKVHLKPDAFPSAFTSQNNHIVGPQIINPDETCSSPPPTVN